ncbi:hypothetical protein CsSME_00016105 [Camellia sinensis var. sinensis]
MPRLPTELRKLLLRILDPNPNTRISIAKIKENSWFKGGLNSKATKTNTDQASGPRESSGMTSEEKQELVKPANLNASDIISVSAGFDRSSLFEELCLKKEAKFTSQQPAKVIISKLEEITKHLKTRVSKKDGGCLKFEGRKVIIVGSSRNWNCNRSRCSCRSSCCDHDSLPIFYAS